MVSLITCCSGMPDFMADLLKVVTDSGKIITAYVGDIVNETTDAIVNAANSSLMGGGGVDGAIHRAGGLAILEDCKRIVARIGNLPTGQAVATSGGKLRARYVIHTVGPVWSGGFYGEPEQLASCYRESFNRADELHIHSVSFPAISTGVYGYPVQEAAKIAVREVAERLEHSACVHSVHFVLFHESALANYRELLQQLIATHSGYHIETSQPN